MRIFVFTSDIYQWSLRAWFWLLEKYWQPTPEVVIAGFTPPSFALPKYATHVSIGPFSEYPAQRWSDAAIKFLRSMPDELFIFMLEDYFIYRPVDARGISWLGQYMAERSTIGRMDLTTDRLFALGPKYPGEIPDYGFCHYFDLIESQPGWQYHMSLITGIWRRKALLGAIQENWTAQECELFGRVPAEYKVLGTRQWPIRHGLAFRASAPGQLDISYLSPEDRSEMTSLGLFERI